MDKNKVIESASKLIAKGALDKAIKEYQRVLEVDPDDVRVLQKLAELYQKMNRKAEAADCFEKVAKTYAAQGFYLKAVALYKQVLKVIDRVEVNVRLAELYANAGAPAPALAHLRRIPTGSASFGAAQELLAIISFQRGEEENGQAAYARAVAAGAKSWELHASYGAATHSRGALDDAIAHYRDALSAGGPSVVRLNLARVLLAKGDAEGSRRELDAVIAAERSGEVFGHAHRLRFGLREPELERELERAGQAALTGEASTLDTASATFDRAIAIDPDLWEAHFGRGIVARQRGDALAAQSSFGRVLELQPAQPDALHELGVALLMGNNMRDALSALDQAAALRPDDPAYVADAGFAHLRAGDLASARARLERATRLDANDPITRSYLGELERVEAAAAKRS